MSAYLIVDVDDIIEYLEGHSATPVLADSANALRNTAALASGLSSPDQLNAIAVADWNKYHRPTKNGMNVQQVYVAAGYDLFNITERKYMADALLTHYFPLDDESNIDELILATSSPDLIKLLDRVKLEPHVRVRVWADSAPAPRKNVIFQPLESIIGVQTKTVGLYVDFENITISLNEQGYIVDLEMLMDGMKRRAQHYGQVVHMAAYAPWGQRGSLPPMLDHQGREISDDIPSRLALDSVDPVFSLPGKNSADLRIAKDVLAESTSPGGAEVVIIASGDRDFNDIYNTLRARGKAVVVWGVRGSTSRVLENNSAIVLEYVDDFIMFRQHKELVSLYQTDVPERDKDKSEDEFRPSQWSSVVLQFDFLQAQKDISITRIDLGKRLVELHVTTNTDRAQDLIDQAIKIGIMDVNEIDDTLTIQETHPLVAQTRLIRDHVVNRVSNTLSVRQWDYVNYGFLLKGIAMDDGLIGGGINSDDNWRSEWIDFLVREGILVRELIPHRHNPDDLVPVIRVPREDIGANIQRIDADPDEKTLREMVFRIIVSVEQFTSFRKFAWCPLGSLHKRLRPFDSGSAFQRAVEDMSAAGAIEIQEYPNPQSDFMTKGISLVLDSEMVERIVGERNHFIEVLLDFYEKRIPITFQALQETLGLPDEQLEMWISIMELENVLNPVPGQDDVYSLFRTHHTVSTVAKDPGDGEPVA